MTKALEARHLLEEKKYFNVTPDVHSTFQSWEA